MRKGQAQKKLSKYALLKVLKSQTPEIRVEIIQYLNDSGINVLSEAIYNTLFNPNRLSRKHIKMLKSQYLDQEKSLRKASKKSNNIKTRKKAIVQNGKGIGALLGVAASLLSSLILHK